MKTLNAIVKVLAVLAAVAGAIYVIAAYGDKIVAWAKRVIGCCPWDEGMEEGKPPSKRLLKRRLPLRRPLWRRPLQRRLPPQRKSPLWKTMPLSPAKRILKADNHKTKPLLLCEKRLFSVWPVCDHKQGTGDGAL